MSNDLHSFWQNKNVVVLSGGVGGAKLVHGLARALPSDSLRVIVNTGDDFEFLSLWISPDLDTIMYTLSGRAPIDRGWGIEHDTSHVFDAAKNLGAPDWFLLGDQDLAVNLMRTDKLRSGARLTEVTQDLFRAHTLPTNVLPMADTPHPTFIRDSDGKTHSFQDWLVKLRAAPVAQEVLFEGRGEASEETLQAIRAADLVILPPSNPFVSIDPILRLESVRDLLRTKPVISVSPIIGGKAVKGPLATMIPSLLHMEASAHALANYYEDVLDLYIVAPGDLDETSTVPHVACDIMMSDITARDRLAHKVLSLARTHGLVGASAANTSTGKATNAPCTS